MEKENNVKRKSTGIFTLDIQKFYKEISED